MQYIMTEENEKLMKIVRAWVGANVKEWLENDYKNAPKEVQDAIKKIRQSEIDNMPPELL